MSHFDPNRPIEIRGEKERDRERVVAFDAAIEPPRGVFEQPSTAFVHAVHFALIQIAPKQ